MESQRSDAVRQVGTPRGSEKTPTVSGRLAVELIKESWPRRSPKVSSTEDPWSVREIGQVSKADGLGRGVKDSGVRKSDMNIGRTACIGSGHR